MKLERRELAKILLVSPAAWLAPRLLRAQTAPPGHVFGSDAAMIFNTVKPDSTGDFEMVLSRLKAALQASTDPQRKQQAQGWKIFKAVEPAANKGVLYIFLINPAVKDADYSVSKILAEAFPSEVNDLYHKFASAYMGGQTMVDLQLFSNLGQAL